MSEEPLFGDETQQTLRVGDILNYVEKSYGPDARRQAEEYAWTQQEDFKYRTSMFKLKVEELLSKYRLRFNHIVYMDGVWSGSDDLVLEDTKFDRGESSPLYVFYEPDYTMKTARKRYRDDG